MGTALAWLHVHESMFVHVCLLLCGNHCLEILDKNKTFKQQRGCFQCLKA